LILFSHGFEGLFLAFLKHACPGSFFEHGEDFDGFHVEDFCNSTLHNEEIGVVDVELDGLEEVLDGLLLGAVAVDKVLALSAHHDLPDIVRRNNKGEEMGKRTWRVTLIWAYSSKPMGDFRVSLLSKTIVTLAFVTPACPRL